MSRRVVALTAALIALAALAGLGFLVLRPRPLPPPPTEAEIAALIARRDALQDRLRDVIVANGETSLGAAPKGDVMIGIPTSFTSAILGEIVTGLFQDMTLTLKNLKVHKEGDVRTKILVARKTVGHYVLDVNIHQVRGVLRPGRPELRFEDDRVAVTLPVRLAEGSGSSDIRLQWDSKGLLSNAVCGDTDVTKTVTGGVIPQDYVLKGAFRIVSDGEAITLRPDFTEELKVRILVDPSEQAWRAVDEVVEAQRKGCEIVLEKINIKELLNKIVSRGFNVKIPQKLIKPVRIPAGIQKSLELQGLRVSLDVRSTGLKVASDRLWYGADVGLDLGRKEGAEGDRTP